ncbi:MAG: hypothetical protein CSA23_07625 [Deltaproteobacteria bacterium]|nr:MAG: hypothetical protein CSA23_07625 [Deltaproteobacteria bacterium]
MKPAIWMTTLICAVLLLTMPAMAAYHHEGERDADKFLSAYPTKAGSKLDNCNLCHSGGSYVNRKGRTVELGSCQWCHQTYGYDGAGDIEETINAYGNAYKAAGRNAEAVTRIDGLDSDGDGVSNADEIASNTFPGDAGDYPGLTPAPYRVYTRDQLEALGSHTQFMLMNTSRSGDSYVEYTGVPMKTLLDDAGMLDTATGIWVYAPDGWGQNHPLEYRADLDMYHVYGNAPDGDFQYPEATYYYDLEADKQQNPDYGWCDYSAPSCQGRTHGDPIHVEGGLKAILAYQRDGAYLDTGVLNDENKLDGEGPFRVVVPQKYVGPPDQSSRSDDQDVLWPYNYDLDHNAGSCSRSATIIKIEPLPEGTTDIDILEAGWSYVDQNKIIVYGAIDGTDSNGNGILDSEEGTSASDDFDGDGIPDYMDTDTAAVRHPNGIDKVRLHTAQGNLADVACISDDDSSLPKAGKPDRVFPYGVNRFNVTGLTAGQTVTVTLVFPGNVPTNAEYYKVTSDGQWTVVPFGSNDGDNQITLALTDGDPLTDADGTANGVIHDPGALTTSGDAPPTTPSSSGGSSGCFIDSLLN